MNHTIFHMGSTPGFFKGEKLVVFGGFVRLFERIFYSNNNFLLLQGTLGNNTMRLTGQVDRGRFGNSVASLGDVDDDGYEGWQLLYNYWMYTYVCMYVHTYILTYKDTCTYVIVISWQKVVYQ